MFTNKLFINDRFKNLKIDPIKYGEHSRTKILYGEQKQKTLKTAVDRAKVEKASGQANRTVPKEINPLINLPK